MGISPDSPRGGDFHDEAVEDEPVVEAGGDECLVCLEGGFHDFLKVGQREVFRIIRGEEDGENIYSGAVFFLG